MAEDAADLGRLKSLPFNFSSIRANQIPYTVSM